MPLNKRFRPLRIQCEDNPLLYGLIKLVVVADGEALNINILNEKCTCQGGKGSTNWCRRCSFDAKVLTLAEEVEHEVAVQSIELQKKLSVEPNDNPPVLALRWKKLGVPIADCAVTIESNISPAQYKPGAVSDRGRIYQKWPEGATVLDDVPFARVVLLKPRMPAWAVRSCCIVGWESSGIKIRSAPIAPKSEELQHRIWALAGAIGPLHLEIKHFRGDWIKYISCPAICRDAGEYREHIRSVTPEAKRRKTDEEVCTSEKGAKEKLEYLETPERNNSKKKEDHPGENRAL